MAQSSPLLSQEQQHSLQQYARKHAYERDSFKTKEETSFLALLTQSADVRHCSAIPKEHTNLAATTGCYFKDVQRSALTSMHIFCGFHESQGCLACINRILLVLAPACGTALWTLHESCSQQRYLVNNVYHIRCIYFGNIFFPRKVLKTPHTPCLLQRTITTNAGTDVALTNASKHHVMIRVGNCTIGSFLCAEEWNSRWLTSAPSVMHLCSSAVAKQIRRYGMRWLHLRFQVTTHVL